MMGLSIFRVHMFSPVLKELFRLIVLCGQQLANQQADAGPSDANEMRAVE